MVELVPPVGPDACQVWWARPRTLAAAPAWDRWAARWSGLLDDAELTRRDGYRREADRSRFTVAAVLLRLLAGAHLGLDPAAVTISRDCPDCNRPHGRPILPAVGWECSVSHSGDRVAVAIGRTGALGVDVEDSARQGVGAAAGTGLGDGAADRTAGSPDDGLVAYALTTREAADLAAYTANHPGVRPDREGLLAYWTRKEAVLKAIGTGLREPLRGVEVSAPDAEPRLLSAASDPRLPGRTVLRSLDPGEGYIASLAVLDTPDPVVTEHDATALLASG